VSEEIRCFLAVEISDEVRKAAAELTERLQKGIRFTKARPSWVKSDNLHFTIVFLGKRPPEEVERIKSALADIPEAIEPFGVEVGGVGVFPNARSPRVLWVGVKEGGAAFRSLYGEIVERLRRAIGFKPEKRPYHPHLTLARIRSLRGAAEMMEVVKSHHEADCGRFTASGLTFFRSQLHPEGAIYTPLARWPFGKTGRD